MRGLFRFAAAFVTVFFIIVVGTTGFHFIKRAWFGGVGSGPHVGVIDISGVISSSTSKLRELEEMAKDTTLKALVVRVNSPGGLAAPSEELYQAIKRIDEKIPVVISMGSLAASGGYYLSLGGRKIVANPSTLTASIGVIVELANIQKLYEWAHIERYTLTGGKFKAMGTPNRPMTPEERALLQNLINNIHQQFKNAVKERRKLSDEAMITATDGRVMTGVQALEIGLIDKLGDLDTALILAKELSGLPKDANVIFEEHKTGLLMKLLFGDDSTKEEFLSLVRGFSGTRVLLQAMIQ